ncbi:hypothetical protein [Sphingomonas sp.]|uniref:hypothetical protein n=1 Tax=Sphingomonas sp. TaxID=28214 RepID=UPI001B2F248D|nr:hypothetical protein [Sphingomonas sp.]MBO9712025.1 hypothetical protein [Sphingomonas sp.]
MRSSNALIAYWLPTVGIGKKPAIHYVHVPLTEVLNYRRADGTPQVDVVNLGGCTFNVAEDFDTAPLWFDPVLQTTLQSGAVAQLQGAGIKVLLTIQGSGNLPGTPMGWESVTPAQLPILLDYINNQILGSDGYNLDGIDVDDEWGPSGPYLEPTMTALGKSFNGQRMLTQAVTSGYEVPADAKPYVSFVNTMVYGDDFCGLVSGYQSCLDAGFAPGQVTIGVNAGPVAQGGGGFTSVATTEAATAWQPDGATKLGMMLWTFSQDIQQFTANPQNQPDKLYPNADDHSWQAAIIAVMQGEKVTIPTCEPEAC